MGRDCDQLKKERTRRVTWIDKSDDKSSIEKDKEVLNVQRVQRPTYLTTSLNKWNFALKNKSRNRQSVNFVQRLRK